MTVWVTSLLIDAGVSAESITWGANSGGDEIDIIADIEGQSVFFELKDREFGLGDAFPFSSRLARYGGHVGVVITMATVAGEARRLWFDDPPPKKLILLEGEEQIKSLITSLVDLVAWESVLAGVQAICPSGIAPPIVYHWMKEHSQPIAEIDTIPVHRLYMYDRRPPTNSFNLERVIPPGSPV